MSLKSDIDNLIWHIEVGVDALYTDSPLNFKKKSSLEYKNIFSVDREFKTIDSDNQSTQNIGSSSITPALSAKEEANKLANEAGDLYVLEEKIKNFSGCLLSGLATNTVFSDGNTNSPLMIIGEAPGAEEDKLGKPFVGQAGKLLDRMLNAIGRDRSNTYITNVVFWRPPGNRKPTDEEISVCLPFVKKHICLIKPKLLVLLGAVASQALLEVDEGIMRIRGKWYNLDIQELNHSIDVMPIYHPAFLLRQPSHKKEAWEDLKNINAKLKKFD